MSNVIRGLAYVLGDNIDTDQIIPAMHLVYNVEGEESSMYGKLAMSGLPEQTLQEQPFVLDGEETSNYSVMIAGSNFGCGSSREHAPLAIGKAGVKAIIANDYARIFYRNSVDGGFVIPYESNDDLQSLVKTGDEVEINLDDHTLKNLSQEKSYALKDLGTAKDIIEAGGIFEYARQSGLVK